jgi:hypothetical protein
MPDAPQVTVTFNNVLPFTHIDADLYDPGLVAIVQNQATGKSLEVIVVGDLNVDIEDDLTGLSMRLSTRDDVAAWYTTVNRHLGHESDLGTDLQDEYGGNAEDFVTWINNRWSDLYDPATGEYQDAVAHNLLEAIADAQGRLTPATAL